MEWTISRIYELAFGSGVDTFLDLNGVIEEKSRLMNLSLQILKKGKILPSGIFSIINNSLKIPIDQLAIQNKMSFFNISELDEMFEIKKPTIEIVTQAKLPIKKTNDAKIIVFKFNNEPKEFFCILIGKINRKNQYKSTRG